MSYWENKVALISGGSRGLGRVLAETLAGCGARVVLAARGADDLDSVARRIRQRGGTAESVPTDVLVDAQVDRLVAHSIDRFGRLDLLANCAGRSTRAAVLDTTPADFQRAWELNFLAMVRCTRAAAPHLMESRGHLVQVGSLASKTASRYLGAYPASKFAVAAYSQQLRLELAPRGLHVLLVCPGPLARSDAGRRYERESDGLPESAARAGGGARVPAVDPGRLADRVVVACERRRAELVVPGSARWLFALSQLSPRLGDWLLRKFT